MRCPGQAGNTLAPKVTVRLRSERGLRVPLRVMLAWELRYKDCGNPEGGEPIPDLCHLIPK